MYFSFVLTYELPICKQKIIYFYFISNHKGTYTQNNYSQSGELHESVSHIFVQLAMTSG